VRAAIQPKASYRTPTALVVLENTHNLAGGRITPSDRMRELIKVAREHGLPVHLDGARIHNAAAALNMPAAELARGCDTIMFCLSKGLAAPLGSLLVGDADAMVEAKRIRRMFGGGMRQVGVVAAAGLVSLDEMLQRLDEDNQLARRLGERVAGLPGIDLDLQTVDTNIVFFSLTDDALLPADELASRLAEEGILVHALGRDRVRMVTHYHICADDVDAAARAVERLLSG
jgi:threonine aldolase